MKNQQMLPLLLIFSMTLTISCGNEEAENPANPAQNSESATQPPSDETATNPATNDPDDTNTDTSPGDLTFLDCGEAEGDAAPQVEYNGQTLTIAWGDSSALGVYVTDPDATLPMGPDAILTGTAYWVLEMESFPAGFGGPVTYGQVPEGAIESTTKHGGNEGGATLEAGICYKISVVTTMFSTGSTFLGWEYR